MISDKTVYILVQSRGASYRAALTAVVTYSVTDYQHHFNINATSWRIPQNEHASERKKRIRYCYPRISVELSSCKQTPATTASEQY